MKYAKASQAIPEIQRIAAMPFRRLDPSRSPSIGMPPIHRPVQATRLTSVIFDPEPSSSCATMPASGNRAGARQVHALGSSFDASKSVRTWDCSQDVSENAELHLKCFRAVVLVVTRSHCDDEIEARNYAD